MARNEFTYSQIWYETFLETIPEAATLAEVAFVRRHFPVARFSSLLDLCCGTGRHAGHLAATGYTVTGVDENTAALAIARERFPAIEFHPLDMRRLRSLAMTFDGVINLWHSFGYFDEETNLDILRAVYELLAPGGRFLIDIYNREHFASLPAVSESQRGGRTIQTTRTWEGNRHRVRLVYDGGLEETIEWIMYSPSEFSALCAQAGFQPVLACAWFDESIEISPAHARMQFLLERSWDTKFSAIKYTRTALSASFGKDVVS